jgi:feruloyl esterase
MHHITSSRASVIVLSAACAVALQACGTAPPTAGMARAANARSCEVASFADLRLAGANIQSVTAVAQNGYTPAGQAAAMQDVPAFCLIKGDARPTSDSLINFELWVPREGWNGKLVVTGNGGYSPALSYTHMAYAMRQGYAALGGDTGHQPADPNSMDWGVGHSEKIPDWGSRSVHAITVPGKALVTALQGKPATRAYYYGCSTGGHQAYAEVQRYPDDFDGVIAGAPGSNRVALNAEFLWRFQSNRQANTNNLILTPAKASLITAKAVETCDGLDGVKDGVMADPRQCTSDKFNVASLQCRGADGPDCLTAAQVDAAQKIYQGPKNLRGLIYPGPVVGTESTWPIYWEASAPVRADFWALWQFDNPRWDWWTFDYDRDYNAAAAKLGPLVDLTDPDIRAFKARGAKLISYHGWGDAVVSALDTIKYYEQVREQQGSQQATDSFFRLFLVPGMGHCQGGSGPTVFGNQGLQAPDASAANDLLMALDRWVESGSAPDAIVASQMSGNAVSATRPLCAYPKRAVYKGTGSTDSAANFSCQ